MYVVSPEPLSGKVFNVSHSVKEVYPCQSYSTVPLEHSTYACCSEGRGNLEVPAFRGHYKT
jgi:hypothetical protein